MQNQKIIFIDRDGTLINEPEDEQIDSLQKLKLEPGVIPALLQLQLAGFVLVMISNQDGLGTSSFPIEDFTIAQEKLLEIFTSQGIQFSAIRICPHLATDGCECRKPRIGLIIDFLVAGKIDMHNSYVIGDRQTDLQLAEKIGISGILYDGVMTDWPTLALRLTQKHRSATVKRVTNETAIEVCVNLDAGDNIEVNTGIGFFDHMLAQLAKHAGISLHLAAAGDYHIDEHHTVEDTALALGQALRQALGDKLGIERYGFLLPMDEALATIAIDLSGRPFSNFSGQFTREEVGTLPTELIPHFFRSFAETLGATINISVTGENTHHMIESVFKGVGRALKMAIKKNGNALPTTKGVL